MEIVSLIIEKATIKDLSKISELMSKQAEDEREFIHFNKKEDFSFYTLSDIKKVLTSLNCLMLLAKLNGKVVGCGLAKIEDAPSWSKHKKQGYLGMLYVDKNYRRHGIAKAIREARIKWLKSKGIKLLACLVLIKNIPAIAFAHKDGFKPNSTWMFKEMP